MLSWCTREKSDVYKLVVEEIGLPRLEPKVHTEDQFNLVMTQSPKFAETIQKEGIIIT